MTRWLRPASMALVVFAVTTATGSAQAQCGFQHPKSAKQLRSALVQAMIPCDGPGGLTPNTTTEGGVPACAPPETENEEDGSPVNGWIWHGSSSGVIYLKSSNNKQLPGPLNPPNARDVAVTLKLYNIHDQHGVVAHAPGKLIVTLRVTMQDRQNGNMTSTDWPIDFDFMVQGADAAMKTTVNARLNAEGMPSLPGCSSIEVVAIDVLDENGNRFGNAGVYLPRGS